MNDPARAFDRWQVHPVRVRRQRLLALALDGAALAVLALVALGVVQPAHVEAPAAPIASALDGVQYVMAVHEDGSLVVPADGDYVPLTVDGSGALWVTCTGCSGGGTFNTDNAATTSGTATALNYVWDGTSWSPAR